MAFDSQALSSSGQNHSVRLLIVGEGPKQLRTEAIVAGLGLQQKIPLHGIRRNVPRLLQAADIFLANNVSDAIPLTLIEAMSCGQPCVPPRVGGRPEVIFDVEMGMLPKPSTAQSLAGRLDKLVRESSLRYSIGVAGRTKAQQLFDGLEMHAACTSRRIYSRMLGMEPCLDEPHCR